MTVVDHTDAPEPALPLRSRVRWGQVWRDRLIDQGWLDARRIRLGQGNVARTEVDSFEISPGRVSRVWNAPGSHEAVWIEVDLLASAQWDTVVATIAGRARHTAAVLDGAVEAGLVTELRDAGIELMPSPERLTPQCGCIEKEAFCSHAIALVHALLHEVNINPFALFTIRGRTHDQLLAEVRRSRQGETTSEADLHTATMTAAEAWARVPADLPIPPRALPSAGAVGRWASDSTELIVDPDVLRELATDAVHRSWTMVRGDARSALELDLDADIARRAVGLLGTTRIVELAREMDEPAQRVIGLATAWRAAGPGGLAMLSEPAWEPDPFVLNEAVEAIIASGKRESSVVAEDNTVTVANKVQYRFSADQTWYRLDLRAKHWMLLYPPAVDIQDLFAPGKSTT